MSSYTRYRERNRDIQDGVERHVWGKQEYVDKAGSIIKVRGTDTEDEEAPVLNNGTSFNLKEKSNSEVMLLSSGSDTTLKMAMLTIPRDKQRRWPENEGGIQHPTDPEVSLHLSDKLTHVTKNKFAVGEKGEFEVRGDTLYIRASKVVIEGELVVNRQIKTPKAVQGSEKIPGFEGNKQEEKKSSQTDLDDAS
jgi:hypothetical protein